MKEVCLQKVKLFLNPKCFAVIDCLPYEGDISKAVKIM